MAPGKPQPLLYLPHRLCSFLRVVSYLGLAKYFKYYAAWQCVFQVLSCLALIIYITIITALPGYAYFKYYAAWQCVFHVLSCLAMTIHITTITTLPGNSYVKYYAAWQCVFQVLSCLLQVLHYLKVASSVLFFAKLVTNSYSCVSHFDPAKGAPASMSPLHYIYIYIYIERERQRWHC